MIRPTRCALAVLLLATSFAQAQNTGPQSKVTPIPTLSWQQPDSWLRLVAGDEKDLGPEKILQPELASPAGLPLANDETLAPPVPDAPIRPVPDNGIPGTYSGQPNSNLPPQQGSDDPDYSEIQRQERAQSESTSPDVTATDTNAFQTQKDQPSFDNGSMSNGYWFDSSDGCGESCGESVFSNSSHASCFRCLSDEGCSIFTAYTGAVFLHRNASKHQRLVSNPANLSQNLNAGDFDFGTQSGIEVGATAHRLFGELDLDLRFFNVGDFSDRERRQTTGGVTRINMAFPADLIGPRSIVANYGSDLSSFEAGLRFRMGAANDWTTFWLGLRVLDIGETLNGSFVSPGAAQPTQNLSVDVANRLFGVQVGMDETIIGDCRHSLESYWRAGIYNNNSSSSTSLIAQSAPPAIFRSQGGADKTAFVGEVGLKGKLRLTRNLNMYGRYQLLFAEGLALAGEQPAATNLLSRTGHSSNGGLFYHGAMLGLEYVY